MIDTSIRILAAIMFTDMVGYTALMQANEQIAKKLRDKHREVLEAKIFGHRGKILQYYGDGTLSIFGSAIEAVKCAVEIQKELQTEPKIPLRIGIHIGDIVYEDDGVFGDGVNVASRIESLSIPGGVLISEKVFDEIKNQSDLPTISLGDFELKNIRKPMELFALGAQGLVIPDVLEMRTKSGYQQKSIAVLPFLNMSADQENEYFSDGITEEIINALTKVDGLKVTSRTSSFAFKNKNDDIRKIGTELNVSTVLEGSVRRSGNRVRITAQLINTHDGYHQWSEVYDRKLEDIFDLQDEISRTIANKLREKLQLSDVKETLVKSYTKDLEAYNLYLKGLYYWNKWTPEGMKKAIEFFSKSIEKENDFALPYAGMANCYTYLGAIGYMPSLTAFPKAKEAALNALRLDDTRMESNLSLALIKLFYEWDFAGAKALFEKLLLQYPGAADVHYAYSMYLMSEGKVETAVRECEIAHEQDPLSLPINSHLGSLYTLAGRYDDAINILKNVLEIDPAFRSATYNLGLAFLFKKDFDRSIETLKKAQDLAGDELKGLGPLGFAHGIAGKRDEALNYLNKLQRRKEKEPEVSLEFDYAVIYAGLGDFEKSFDYLEEAVEKKSGGLVFLKSQIAWREVSSHPRFISILKEVGLEAR